MDRAPSRAIIPAMNHRAVSAVFLFLSLAPETRAGALMGKDGKVIAFFPSKVTPQPKELREAIEKALR
jgi:hypothetical protein